jgi:hypothetical protein
MNSICHLHKLFALKENGDSKPDLKIGISLNVELFNLSLKENDYTLQKIHLLCRSNRQRKREY